MVMARWRKLLSAAGMSGFGGVGCSHTGRGGKGVRIKGLCATSMLARIGPRKCAAAFEI